MDASTSAPQHRLVHVRGGSQMLFTALCVSLLKDAQNILSAFLWIVPFVIYLKAPLLTAGYVRRAVTALLLQAVAEVTNKQSTASQWRARLQESQLLAKATQLTLKYLRYKKLSKMLLGPLLGSTGGGASADYVASLTDAALCERVVALVGRCVPARSPASQRAVANPQSVRVCASLFATNTATALQSYLTHVLTHSGRHTPVTLYLPGFLGAPWTSHLTPLLRCVERQYGARVVGYDVHVDAHRYEVDLKHLHQLAEEQQQQQQRGESGNRAKSSLSVVAQPASATKNPLSGTAPAPSVPPVRTSGVLFLASVRGRAVHNRDKAFEFAKTQGWQVVELAVPTLPPDAMQAGEADPSAHLMRGPSATATTASANWSFATLPDVHITAFDDAGMYGGSVVHLCVSDPLLISHMKSECEAGLADRGGDALDRRVGLADGKERRKKDRSSSSRRVPALCTLPSTALATTSDLTVRSSEYVTHVWLPWAGRLCSAVQDETVSSLQTITRVQQSLASSGRVALESLIHLPFTVQQGVKDLVTTSNRALRDGVRALQGTTAESGGADTVVDAGPLVGGEQRGAAGKRVTAETPVEQRTTIITQPLSPLDLVPAHTLVQQQPQRQTQQAQVGQRGKDSSSTTQSSNVRAAVGDEGVPTLSSDEGLAAQVKEGDAATKGVSALTAWMPRLPSKETNPAAPASIARASETEMGVANTAAEWRIRLRWTALLLAPYLLSPTTDTPANVAALTGRNVCAAAAYVSLWSFVAQLPPWLGAVSAENEASQLTTACTREPSGGCVEVAATAVLVRVAYPATPAAVAQLLRDEAGVDARAVVTRAWDSRTTSMKPKVEEATASTPSSAAASMDATHAAPGRTGAFQFEDVVLMPGCPKAAALVEELLYIPLGLAMDGAVREAVLRVLWEKVPHAHDAVDMPRRADGAPTPVLAQLRRTYHAYLSVVPAATPAHDGVAKTATGEVVRFPPLELHPRKNDEMDGNKKAFMFGLSKEDVELAQQLIFDTAQSRIAAAAAPPSFVTHPATSLTTPMRDSVLQKISSKL